MKWLAKFKAARNAAVPLVIIETPDPASTIRACTKAVNGSVATPPLVQWDVLRGARGLNDLGNQIIEACSDGDPATMSSPFDFLSRLHDGVYKVNGKNPSQKSADEQPNFRRSIAFMLNGHKFMGEIPCMQGIWNLRDVFKQVGAMLVILAPAASLEPELKQDVLVISEEFPKQDELVAMATDMIKSLNESGAKIESDEKQLRMIGETLTGTSLFSAEQTLAMCLSKKGVDMEALWDLKCKVIGQTKGLRVWRGTENIDDVKGCANVIGFCKDIMLGNKAPLAVVWIDEIEKAMAGVKSDTSGTSQDQLQMFLTMMQEYEIPGWMAVGHPGTGKSLIAKCMGAISGVPTIAMDLGAMKGGLVGQSEQQIRFAWQQLLAISNNNMIIVATSNGLSILPAELKRRFYMGTYFFGLPGVDERADIWRLYIKKYELKDKEIGFNDDGWTGAEIRACCDIASRTGRPIKEAWRRISPICKTNAAQIEALEKEAQGKFLSASYPGMYQRKQTESAATDGRAIQLA